MTDFTFSPSDFNATTITVVANTPAALEYFEERYGPACISIEVLKSAAPEVAESIKFWGFSYQ
jgi:hypothetical protein